MPPDSPAPGPLHKDVVGNRATKAVMELRAQQCSEWIAAGDSRPTLIRKAREEWGVRVDSFDKVHKQATQLIVEAVSRERPHVLAEKIAIVEVIVEKAMAAEQYSAAIRGMALLGKWCSFGVYIARP